MGRMIVATPAAKRNVMATSLGRFWKELAKLAGSMNEMQQGANSASIPATTAAMTEPPKKMLLSIRFPSLHPVIEVSKTLLRRAQSLSPLDSPASDASVDRFPDATLSRC